MGQRLGGLKTKLDETTAQVGPSKECEDVGVLHKALKSLEDHEDELAMARQPLGRCWALLEFGNVAHVMTPQVHAVREGVGKQQQAAHRLSADIAAKRTEYKEQATELRRVRKLRECHQPWYMALQASKLIPRMIRLRSLQATEVACDKQGAEHLKVWQESDPAKFKSSLNLRADGWEDRLTAFAVKLDTFDGHLSESDVPRKYHLHLRATMFALVLLRASSKEDALEMLWALSRLSERHSILPQIVTCLCISRCVALLPYYDEITNPFMVKDELGKPVSPACPLGLPTSLRNDCRRVPLPLDHPSFRFRIHMLGDKEFVLVPPSGASEQQQAQQHVRLREVLEVAPLCKINSEWVLVMKQTSQQAAEGQPFRVVRGVFESEKCAPGDSAELSLAPHLMLPEGSEGITELYVRVLVKYAEDDSAWQAAQPFGWLYPEATAKGQRRSPVEHVFALYASAASLCHVASATPSPAEKSRSADTDV